MPFKSDKGRNIGKILKIFNTENLGQSLSDSQSITAGLFNASGGIEFTIDSTRYHVFASNDSFVVSTVSQNAVSTYSILLVGGGGGGGASFGSGGGGGGLVYDQSRNVNEFGVTSIPVAIGAGGAGFAFPVSPSQGNKGAYGGVTSFGNPGDAWHHVALGGGGGSRYSTPDPYNWSLHPPTAVTTPDNTPLSIYEGMSGGSGGGAGGGPGTFVGGLGRQETYPGIPASSRFYGHGNDGGDNVTYSTSNHYSRTGGGGAGTAGGSNIVSTPAPAGGGQPGPGLDSWGWGGDGYQVPAPFMPTDNSFPGAVISALGGIPNASPEYRYFAGGGGGGSNGGPETSGLDSNGYNRGGLGNNSGPGGTYEYGFGNHTTTLNGGDGGNGCTGRGGGGGGGVWSTGGSGAGGGGCVIISYPIYA
jgi:hypothetical protein